MVLAGMICSHSWCRKQAHLIWYHSRKYHRTDMIEARHPISEQYQEDMGWSNSSTKWLLMNHFARITISPALPNWSESTRQEEKQGEISSHPLIPLLNMAHGLWMFKLLDFGAEIDRMDDSEESALHFSDLVSAYWWAMNNNRPRIVQLLVKNNPLLNKLSENGFKLSDIWAAHAHRQDLKQSRFVSWWRVSATSSGW